MKYLSKYGYERTPQTEGLFKHKTRDITFTLMVNDFRMKYTQEADVEHLITAVRAKYPFKVDMEAKQ